MKQELAVGDLRSEHSAPDHPLRIVGDYLAGPDGTLEARKSAVASADQWLLDGGDSEIGLRVLMHAVQPSMRHVYSDPGLGNTVTIAEAALPLTQIREISALWDSVLTIVARERPLKLAPLIEELHHWVYPGILAFGRGPDEETAAALKDEATRVISRLVEILGDRPGLRRRLNDYASKARLAANISVPSEFEALFPTDWDGSEEAGGHDGWALRVDEAVRILAGEFQQLPVGEIAERIVLADSEAASAGISYPRLTPRMAQLIAEGTNRPELVLDVLEQRGASGDLLQPFIDRVVELQPLGWEHLLERLLLNDEKAWYATQIILTRSVGSRLKNLAIGRMTPGYSNMVHVLIARRQIDFDTIERLLNCPERLIARDTAVALVMGGSLPADLPPPLRQLWREVIVQSPADDYWYSVILQRDADLFVEWLRAWFARTQSDESKYKFLPHTLEEAIGKMPSSTTCRTDSRSSV